MDLVCVYSNAPVWSDCDPKTFLRSKEVALTNGTECPPKRLLTKACSEMELPKGFIDFIVC